MTGLVAHYHIPFFFTYVFIYLAQVTKITVQGGNGALTCKEFCTYQPSHTNDVLFLFV